MTGTLAANAIAEDADVVIAVGTRLGDFATASKSQFKNPAVRIVSLNNNRYHACKMDAVKAVGDAKATLEKLAARLREKGYRSAWQNEIRDAKAAWDAEMKGLKTNWSAAIAAVPTGFVPGLDIRARLAAIPAIRPAQEGVVPRGLLRHDHDIEIGSVVVFDSRHFHQRITEHPPQPAAYLPRNG